jgi:hypothetical protein
VAKTKAKKARNKEANERRLLLAEFKRMELLSSFDPSNNPEFSWVKPCHVKRWKRLSDGTRCYICNVLLTSTRVTSQFSTSRTKEHPLPKAFRRLLRRLSGGIGHREWVDLWDQTTDWSCWHCNTYKYHYELTLDLIAKLAADRIDSSFHCCG